MSQRVNVNGVGWPGGDCDWYLTAKCDHKGMSQFMTPIKDRIENQKFLREKHEFYHSQMYYGGGIKSQASFHIIYDLALSGFPGGFMCQ